MFSNLIDHKTHFLQQLFTFYSVHVPQHELKKKNAYTEVMVVIANAMVVIILLYVSVSSQHAVHLKLTQSSMSFIFQ